MRAQIVASGDPRNQSATEQHGASTQEKNRSDELGPRKEVGKAAGSTSIRDRLAK